MKMKTACAALLVIFWAAGQSVQPASPDLGLANADESGFQSIFDGKTMNAWDGAPGFWQVKDGAIVGKSTKAHPAGATYLIWRGAGPDDFELKLELKWEGIEGPDGIANSGIKYRGYVASYPNLQSKMPSGTASAPPPGGSQAGIAGVLFNPAYEAWFLAGYQYDINVGTIGAFEGSDPAPPGYLAHPGQMIRVETGQSTTILGRLGDSAASVKPSDWNRVHIIARGNTFIHILNGQVSTIAVDDSRQRSRGLIGIQLESTHDATVSVRNIRLKTLPK